MKPEKIIEILKKHSFKEKVWESDYEKLASEISQQQDVITERADKKINKMRKALETIRDAFYTDGETHEEQVADLKAIAHNVLYEIDNNLP